MKDERVTWDDFRKRCDEYDVEHDRCSHKKHEDIDRVTYPQCHELKCPWLVGVEFR